MSEPDLRALLRQAPAGEALPRPIFAPLIFGLAAKVAGTPAQGFTADPTQIANTLRRLQSHLRLDVLTAYYGSCLAAEALGCRLGWAEYPPVIVERPALDVVSASAAGIEHRGRVPVALDVVRRLRATLGETLPLLVGITGPYALARQLAPDADDARLGEALELAGGVFRQLAQHFSEAGADIVVAAEEPPAPASPLLAGWGGQLGSAGKVVRFYKGLPVLLLPGTLGPSERATVVAAGAQWVVCPTIDSLSPAALAGTQPYGLALPNAWLDAPQLLAGELEQRGLKPFRPGQPLLITTAGEVPMSHDARRLPSVVGALRSAVR